MTRKDALTAIRVAGYHDDSGEFTELLARNRVSLDVARDSFRQGSAQRVAGVPCVCRQCAEVSR